MAAEGGTFNFNTGARRVPPVRIKFADGEHAVPGWVVASIGEDELKTSASDLAAITFEEFSTSFSRQMAGEQMERLQSLILAAHLGGFR